MRSAVVLPQPDGPSSTRNSPSLDRQVEPLDDLRPRRSDLSDVGERDAHRDSAFDRADQQAARDVLLQDAGDDDRPGAIIRTISTDMFHHCGPRVAFCAETRTGMVCALALERNSASRYSFQARISTSRKVATRPERTSGRAIVKKMRNFEAPSISALSSRSSGMRGEEIARQPDDDRQVDRGVGGDQRDLGVEQAAAAGT